MRILAAIIIGIAAWYVLEGVKERYDCGVLHLEQACSRVYGDYR